MSVLSLIVKGGILAVVINEVRGLVMAAPALWIAVEKGYGLWVVICIIGGIALSILIPHFAIIRIVRWYNNRQETET